MNTVPTTCVVCGNRINEPESGVGDFKVFRCNRCGDYKVTGSCLSDLSGKRKLNLPTKTLTYLSHMSRSHFESGKRLEINSYLIQSLKQKEPQFPSFFQKINTLIQHTGDKLQNSGERAIADEATVARIGCRDQTELFSLIKSACEENLIRDEGSVKADGNTTHSKSYVLTFKGWSMYDDLKHGKLNGSYGFLAMKFGDTKLEEFASATIKKSCAEDLGYEIQDVRDIAQAGIIDNILREQIRGCKFAIVDLTHDNPGAYWEAGYAEGLGKPVIYICERNKFSEKKTHFDTNHCTTVLWDSSETEHFRDEFVATVRRSLGQ